MSKANTDRKARLMQKGVVTTLLLSTLAMQAVPVIQVGAETVNYSYDTQDLYKSVEGQYVIEVNPMAGVALNQLVKPRSGQFTIKQTEQYGSSGDTREVDGAEVRLNLDSKGENRFILDSDGTYTIKNTGRIPGFFLDTSTYQYTLPLIVEGKPTANQTVEFHPKLTQVVGDIEFKKVTDTNEPMEGVEFKLYRTYDAETGEGTKTEPVQLVSLVNIHILDVEEEEGHGTELATLTTGEDGTVVFDNLKEGEYYVQEVGTIEGYARNNTRVKFEVTTDVTGQELVVREIGGSNIDENNLFMSYRRTSMENRLETSYTEEREDGEIIVSTDGIVKYHTDIKVPKDVTKYDRYVVTSDLPSGLSLEEGTIKVAGLTGETETDLTEYVTVGKLDGGVTQLKMDASKDTDLQKALDGVESLEVTYEAKVVSTNVETEDIIKANIEVSWDNKVGDIGTMNQELDVTVKEGALGVIKKEEDGTLIEGAEFTLYEEGTGENELIHNDVTYIPAVNPRNGEEYKGETNEEGRLLFESIPYGEYLLVETKAPEGYLNNHEYVEGTIEDTEEPMVEGVLNSKVVEVNGIKKEDATIVEIIDSDGLDGFFSKDENGNYKYQQTGATILWGSVLLGASATAMGAYVVKKGKDEGKEESEESTEG